MQARFKSRNYCKQNNKLITFNRTIVESNASHIHIYTKISKSEKKKEKNDPQSLEMFAMASV